MNTLKAEKRNMTTKAKKLRREGFVTGNLFGREMTESIPLQMDKRAVDQLLKDEGKGGQVMLEVLLGQHLLHFFIAGALLHGFLHGFLHRLHDFPA